MALVLVLSKKINVILILTSPPLRFFFSGDLFPALWSGQQPFLESSVVYKTQNSDPHITLLCFIIGDGKSRIFLQLTWNDFIFSEGQLALDPCHHYVVLSVSGWQCFTQTEWLICGVETEYLDIKLLKRRMWEWNRWHRENCKNKQTKPESFKKYWFYVRPLHLSFTGWRLSILG